MALLIIVAVSLGLFWPVYDLSISKSINWTNYQTVETNFLTLGACRKAAGNYIAADWVCLKKTGWGQMTNDYSKYDSKHQ